ncbi:MAG: chemotaxis protein CheW [Candidatus Hodarchaeales archaeon]
MNTIQTTMSNRYLVFQIMNDYYGIKIDFIKEVYNSNKILKLPKTSQVLAGIIDLRGYILSVFDLSMLLWEVENQKEIEESQNIILVVTVHGQDIGILVDQIYRLIEITDFTKVDSVSFNEKKLVNSSLITQIGKLAEDMNVYIVDPEKAMEKHLTMVKSPEKIPLEEEDLDFDFSQYTLPDEESEILVENVTVEEPSKKGKKK